MLTLNFGSHFPSSKTMPNFHQRLKVRIVSKSDLSWLSKMPKIAILGAPEAEKLHISRWPKYCETPCTLESAFYGFGGKCTMLFLI